MMGLGKPVAPAVKYGHFWVFMLNFLGVSLKMPEKCRSNCRLGASKKVEPLTKMCVFIRSKMIRSRHVNIYIQLYTYS